MTPVDPPYIKKRAKYTHSQQLRSETDINAWPYFQYFLKDWIVLFLCCFSCHKLRKRSYIDTLDGLLVKVKSRHLFLLRAGHETLWVIFSWTGWGLSSWAQATAIFSLQLLQSVSLYTQKRAGLHPKLNSILYIVHYFWPKVLHYIGKRVPIGMQPWRVPQQRPHVLLNLLNNFFGVIQLGPTVKMIWTCFLTFRICRT